MDKKLMLAVAGAGKTTYIINKVCTEYRKVLVITYTDANYNNIIFKLREQNDEVIPDGIIGEHPKVCVNLQTDVR